MTHNQSYTMRFRAVGRFLVFVHSRETPSDLEWNAAMRICEELMAKRELSSLVYSEGGAPSATQRALLNRIAASHKPRIAVLTASPIARAAGVAIRWFNPALRTFEPEALDAALDHIGAVGAERAELSDALIELRRELATSPARFAR